MAWEWVWMMAWVLLVRDGSAGGITSNSSYMETMLAACNTAPVWKLNMCNLTCGTCVTSEPNQCASCDANYLYSSPNSDCSTTNTYNTFSYIDYLSTPLLLDKEIFYFERSMTGSPIFASGVVNICSENSYGFQMLGMFSNTD
jgi:hypothetical protein